MFTTLKALKWSHDLGVRQERVRIASHLQVQAQGAHMQRDIMDGMLREEMGKSKPNKNRVERLDFEKAVMYRVEEIINEIFTPNGQYASFSTMFPDDEHKGKVK